MNEEPWAVYALGRGRFSARRYDVREGLVTLAAGGREHAESLARQYQEEGIEMSKGKKAKKANVEKTGRVPRVTDKRLPGPGSILRREYHGKEYEVKVLASGFVLDGETYSSLTAAAMKITGYKAISGFAFFAGPLGLVQKKAKKTA